MTAPGSLLFAKLLYPETEASETAGTVRVKMDSPYDNVVDAAAGGASEGMALTINVVAMLVAFIGLVAMVNGMLGWATVKLGAAAPLTIQRIFGYGFSPLAWLMGVPAGESVQIGQLMGTKTILNEMLAYLDLKQMAPSLSPRSVVIAAYALCGFANLGSVGITLGGMTILAPKRRAELAKLSLPAMFAGMFSTCMTACIAALLIPATEVFAQAPR
jgi:CNT family concentrative nucleoside transporter